MALKHHSLQAPWPHPRLARNTTPATIRFSQGAVKLPPLPGEGWGGGQRGKEPIGTARGVLTEPYWPWVQYGSVKLFTLNRNDQNLDLSLRACMPHKADGSQMHHRVWRGDQHLCLHGSAVSQIGLQGQHVVPRRLGHDCKMPPGETVRTG